MIKKKKLDDYLLHKNTSFYLNFKNKKISQQITEDQIIEKIKTVIDPEIPVNLYDLGLIYNINVDKKNNLVAGSMFPITLNPE